MKGIKGLELFRKCCKDHEIKADDYFHFGRGTGKMVGEQYKLKAAQKFRKNTHQYAVQFCRNENVFVAWDLGPKGDLAEDFYVNAAIVQRFSEEHQDNMISFNETGGTLPFYLFNALGITDFLDKYVVKENIRV